MNSGRPIGTVGGGTSWKLRCMSCKTYFRQSGQHDFERIQSSWMTISMKNTTGVRGNWGPWCLAYRKFLRLRPLKYWKTPSAAHWDKNCFPDLSLCSKRESDFLTSFFNIRQLRAMKKKALLTISVCQRYSCIPLEIMALPF